MAKQGNFSGLAAECVHILVSKRSGRPTVYGWLCLGLTLLLLTNILFGQRKTPSGMNPRFKESMDMQAPMPQSDDMVIVDVEVDVPHGPLGVHEKRKGGILKVPVFDPNQQQQKKQLSYLEQKKLTKYGMPRPKEFPVEILETPRLDCEGGLLLLTIVKSLPESQLARNASRHGWGRQQHAHVPFTEQKWLTIFVMGKPRDSDMRMTVRAENEKYGDILQGDFLDSPFENTRTFMLAMTWLVEYVQSGNIHNRNAAQCRPRFVLKTQGDIFHNMLSIVGWLEKKFQPGPDDQDIYLGKLLRKDVPVRDPYDPMHVPEEDYQPDFFPDMIREPIYLFSYQVFADMASFVPLVTPIAMEDAYIGLLAENVGVKPLDNEHFQLLKITDRRDICHIVNNFFFPDVTTTEHVRLVERLRKCRENQDNF